LLDEHGFVRVEAEMRKGSGGRFVNERTHCNTAGKPARLTQSASPTGPAHREPKAARAISASPTRPVNPDL
jgi:hypothetical protein